MTIEFNIAELNELYVATSNHMNAMVEQAKKLPCAYSDMCLKQAIELNNKICNAILSHIK